MFDRSIIRKSGQWWKFIVGHLGIVIGAFPPILWYRGALNAISDDAKVMLVLIGMGIFIVSFIFVMAGVRCPRCGVRWVWLAARTKSSRGWMVWLVGLESCPKCSFTIPTESTRPQRDKLKT
jgi:hypothetical protein